MDEGVFRIGMIGLGTVGSGVLELLRRRQETVSRRIGRPVRVTRIAVRDSTKPRPGLSQFDDIRQLLTEDAGEVIQDPEVDLVVEVAGGVEDARQWILSALRNGKDVVTANKAVLALHGEEIFRTASENNRRILYEASVAAAIPIIEILQNGLIANQITHLSAILNGTCNFILTRMQEEALGYKEALKLAQEKGFAESDPTLDVSGGDAAHKLALLAGIITKSHISIDAVYQEGIEGIAPEDFTFATFFKKTIKMLGILNRHDDGRWEMRVHPALIPEDDILANVRDEYNAASMTGDAVGRMVIFGKGAGSHPTASSVIADILRGARDEKENGLLHGFQPPQIVPIDEVELSYYIRLTVLDHPGVLGRITSSFGKRGISISSIQQPEAKTGMPIPVVLVTHLAKDRVITETLRGLEEEKLVHGPITRIRIEE